MQPLPSRLAELFVEAQQEEPTRRVSFLLGSGFSRPDGLPLVSDINGRLATLKEGDFFLYQDQSAGFYGAGQPRGPNHRMTYSDRRLAEEFTAFYVSNVLGGNPTKFNYEVFYDYMKEYLRNKLHREEIEGFCEAYNNKYGFKGHFDNALNYLSRYLNIFNQLIAGLLERAKYYQDISLDTYPGYEPFCRALYHQLKRSQVHVHSLNHDMLFDFIASSVGGLYQHYCDGFAEAGSPYFGKLSYRLNKTDEEFYKTYHVRLQHYTGTYGKRLSFFKLHGSINYYQMHRQGDQRPVTIKGDHVVGEVLLERFDDQKQQHVYENPFSDKFPAYLTGTTQKITQYGNAFYKELFEHFQDNLEYSEKLVVIGYGFQDSGINELLEKYYLSQGKPVLVIDVRQPESSLLENYRESFRFSTAGMAGTNHEVYRNFFEE
jgi:hypothetical protein